MAQASEPPKARILLVDDDQIILDSLGGFLEAEGYAVTTAAKAADAINHLQAGRYNLAITDVNMPGGDGMQLLRHITANCPQTAVIMITAYGTIESAVEAMKQGAFEYLTKPIIDDNVRIAIQRAIQQQRLVAENRQLHNALADRFSFRNIIGQDQRMAKVFEVLSAVADSKATVLIGGESGTGKSLLARAIHANSQRRAQPFVEVSCGAIPDTLLESELFGHVRGAFTDAFADKQGKFAAADGGTIFLDEIAAASPQLQLKLLRVLQERRLEPVGSNKTIEVDVRVLLATNRDLAAEVQAGRFREDLYYRVNVVTVALPPLRDRVADIAVLADHFLEKAAAGNGKTMLGFSPQAMALMLRYAWPGNVRELENCVERAVVLSRQPYVQAEDLPPSLAGTAVAAVGMTAADGKVMTLDEALAGPEKQIIMQALAANNGSRNAAAKQLGINRTTLYKKMKKYGLMGESG